MTISITTVTNPLPQNELERFLPTPRAVRAFEDMQTDVTETIPEAVEQIIDLTNELLAAPYIAWQASDTLENERIINAGPGIAVAVGTTLASVSLTTTGVTANTYGSATRLAGLVVDQYGRITFAEDYEINTDNITEGVTNLFYTNARARAALSAGTGIDYDSGTGVIDLEDTAVTPDTYGSATDVPVLTIDQQGRVTSATVAALPVLDSGTYTPTLTNGTNVAASTASVCQWLRVGDTVTVSGRVDIDPTSASTGTQLGISLPVASNFASATNCGGTAVSPNVASMCAAIYADQTNDRAELYFVTGADVANRDWYFSFMYRII